MRQVHAVPRGHALDDADPRASSRPATRPSDELDLLLSVCDRINGKCLCPLGDTAAMAVASYVDKFRDEFVAHLDGGGCPFDDSPLEGILAPVAQHAPTPTALRATAPCA